MFPILQPLAFTTSVRLRQSTFPRIRPLHPSLSSLARKTAQSPMATKYISPDVRFEPSVIRRTVITYTSNYPFGALPFPLIVTRSTLFDIAFWLDLAYSIGTCCYHQERQGPSERLFHC